MKLSFSLSSKSSAKHSSNNLKPSQKFNTDDKPHSPSNKEFVTEFDPSKSLTNSQSKILVIPPKPNEWRPHKRMKNLDLPIQSSSDNNNLQFEVGDTPEEPSDSNISYGLNLRELTKTNTSADTKLDGSIDALMVKRLREDLDRLPEDRGFAEFDDIPVEDFAAALLAGYGWKEGRGIGRNAKEDVKVVQYERRTGKEGLGFVAPMISNSDVVPKSSNGHGKVVLKKEKEENRVFVGKDVRIVGGRDMGLKGRILQVLGSGDYVILKISKSGEEVKVRARDVADLGSVEDERCLKKLEELKIEDKRKDSKKIRDSRKEEPVKSDKLWLISNIRVRIIGKEFKGERLYLKKGKVVDVVGPRTCDISMDDTRELIQGVDQEVLETALPRRGGPVLVLYGRYKGVYGSLVEKDTEKETGVVRDADTHELLRVHLAQIAEYVGDPSDIGY